MFMYGLLSCPAVQLSATALFLWAWLPAQHRAMPTPPAIRADIDFTCLWWSEAQMEGMNPNAPPPKGTEVRLKKWEYSDPVGVPHPDTIDVLITLTTDKTEALLNAEVQVDGQWKQGPLRNAAGAKWAAPAVLKQSRIVAVPSSGSWTLRVPVDLKSVMETSRKQRQWPYGLRVTATVRVPGSAGPATKASAELPITPGD